MGKRKRDQGGGSSDSEVEEKGGASASKKMRLADDPQEKVEGKVTLDNVSICHPPPTTWHKVDLCKTPHPYLCGMMIPISFHSSCILLNLAKGI